MAVVWRFGLLVLGFAAATLVAAFSHVPTAQAQARRAAATADGAAYEMSRAPRPGASQQPVTDPATAYQSAQKSRLRGAVDDADARAADGEPALEDEDGDALSTSDDPAPRRPDDGDLSATVEAPSLSDGLIDMEETPLPLDGEDPARDTRPPEDLEVFDTPPAGHDPLLFQIEDIEAVTTDRRPARLARFEPYDPVGMRIGSFVFFPEAEIGGLATSNVLSVPGGPSDIAADIRTTSRLVSNWSTHAVELKGTTLSSFHDDYASEDDRGWSLEGRGRLDISRRTNVQGLVSRSVSQEDRSAIDANQAGERAEVTSDLAQISLNHRFNRLSVQLRGSVSDTTYAPTDGLSNADRDTLQTTQAVRASWEFKPTLAVFAEHELNQRDKRAAPADGIPRDSEGTRTRVGLDFGATGAILRGTIGVGYGRQTPDDARLGSVETLLLDANLAWRPTEITSVLLTAQSDIYETTSANSGGVTAHTLGLEARHAVRRHLIASAGILYTLYDYDTVPTKEREITTFLGAEYYASPELVLFARYQHVDFASNQANSDYAADELRLGVRVRR